MIKVSELTPVDGTKRINYKEEQNNKETIRSEGNTEVSKHLAHEEHEKEDIKFKILGRDENWYRRGIIEAIHIKREKPELNQDEGRINIPTIYDNVILRRSQYTATDVSQLNSSQSLQNY